MELFQDSMPISSLQDMGLTPQTGAAGPGYEIAVSTWARGLLFGRDDMADAKIAGYAQRIQDMYAVAYAWPDVRLITQLVAGTANTCYIQVGATGEAMFSATHAARGKQTATWSNLLTGSGTSVANCVTDISAAVTRLHNMLNEANRPMNRGMRELFVLYPPAMDVAIRTALFGQIISNTTNVGYAIPIEPISEPLLTTLGTANDYYVGIKDTGAIKGMIWLEMWTNLRQMQFSVTRRGEAGYGRPQRLIKINNT